MAKKTTLLDLYGTMGEDLQEDEFIPTGSIILDTVISNGKGMPRKKFIQFTSESGTGKTTAILFCCKKACSLGHKCVYLDYEKGVNADMLDSIGLTEYIGKEFLLFKPSTYSETEEILSVALDDESEDIAYIVFDSITSIIPDKLMDGEVTSIEVGLKARYDSLFLQKWKAKLERSESKATFIFINQMRTKISFKVTTVEEAGGQAQKYYNDIRFMMRSTEKIKKKLDTPKGEEEVPVGALVDIWALKSRYNNPYVKGNIAILFGKGISNVYFYNDWLVSKKYLTMKGAGFYTLSLPGEEPKSFRGTVNVNKEIAKNVDRILELIEEDGGIQLAVEPHSDDE